MATRGGAADRCGRAGEAEMGGEVADDVADEGRMVEGRVVVGAIGDDTVSEGL